MKKKREKDSKTKDKRCGKIPPKEIGRVYFHINNGGISFSVIDRGYGPTIKVECGHFGHQTNHIEFHTTEKGLECLSRLFEHACSKDYSQLYCDPAKPDAMELDGKVDEPNGEYDPCIETIEEDTDKACNNTISVVLNGVSCSFISRAASYEEIVEKTGGDINVVHSVTYLYKKPYKAGILYPSEALVLAEGMSINAFITNNA